MGGQNVKSIIKHGTFLMEFDDHIKTIQRNEFA